MTQRLSTATLAAMLMALVLGTAACLAAGPAPVQKPKAASAAGVNAACPGASAEVSSGASQGGQQQPQNAPQEMLAYTIGRSDRVNITVEPDVSPTGEGKCSRDYTVGADGKINLCVLNAFKLEGLTEREAEAAIRKAFYDERVYVPPSPQINVLVTTPRSQSVFVSGEVRTPGSTTIEKPSDMTLMHAIANAGGTTPQAGPNVFILRPRRVAPDAEAQPVNLEDTTAQRFKYSRKEMMSNFEDPPIQAGDTIWVEQAEMFMINGEVKSTGMKVWEPCITVGEAIAMAGGMTEKASLGRSYIQRKNAKGRFDKIGGLKLETFLMPKDELVIQKKLF